MTPIILGVGAAAATPGSVDRRVLTDKGNNSSCTPTWWSEDTVLYVLDNTVHVYTFARFANITIPKDAQVTLARIEYTPSYISAAPLSTDIVSVGIQQVDDAAVTTGYADIIARFNALPATIDWPVTSWAVGAPQSSPSLVAQLQALVNRANWAAGNAAAIITRSKVVASMAIQAYSGPQSPSNPERIPRLYAEYLS